MWRTFHCALHINCQYFYNLSCISELIYSVHSTAKIMMRQQHVSHYTEIQSSLPPGNAIVPFLKCFRDKYIFLSYRTLLALNHSSDFPACICLIPGDWQISWLLWPHSLAGLMLLVEGLQACLRQVLPFCSLCSFSSHPLQLLSVGLLLQLFKLSCHLRK